MVNFKTFPPAFYSYWPSYQRKKLVFLYRSFKKWVCFPMTRVFLNQLVRRQHIIDNGIFTRVQLFQLLLDLPFPLVIDIRLYCVHGPKVFLYHLWWSALNFAPPFGVRRLGPYLVMVHDEVHTKSESIQTVIASLLQGINSIVDMKTFQYIYVVCAILVLPAVIFH